MKEFHPFSLFYPEGPDPELKALADDIGERGQLVPVLLAPDGRIADGRRRYRAMRFFLQWPEEKVIYQDFEGTEDQLLAHVQSLNHHRRQLSPSQRACVAVLHMDRYRRQAKRAGMEKSSPPVDCISSRNVSRSQSAREWRVSSSYIANAATLFKRNKGFFYKVFNGGMKLSDAYKHVKNVKQEAPRGEPGENEGAPPRREKKETMVTTDTTLPPESPEEALPEDDQGEDAEEVSPATPPPAPLPSPVPPRPPVAAGPAPTQSRETSFSFRCLPKGITIRISIDGSSAEELAAFSCPFCRAEQVRTINIKSHPEARP